MCRLWLREVYHQTEQNPRKQTLTHQQPGGAGKVNALKLKIFFYQSVIVAH